MWYYVSYQCFSILVFIKKLKNFNQYYYLKIDILLIIWTVTHFYKVVFKFFGLVIFIFIILPVIFFLFDDFLNEFIFFISPTSDCFIIAVYNS